MAVVVIRRRRYSAAREVIEPDDSVAEVCDRRNSGIDHRDADTLAGPRRWCESECLAHERRGGRDWGRRVELLARDRRVERDRADSGKVADALESADGNLNADRGDDRVLPTHLMFPGGEKPFQIRAVLAVDGNDYGYLFDTFARSRFDGAVELARSLLSARRLGTHRQDMTG